MVKEYFILNSKNLNFNCFSDPNQLENKVNEVFNIEKIKWTNTQSSSGSFLQAFYETEAAHIKIEIMKTKKELPYVFHLTVLGGDNPLSEVARLCKHNSWNAYDANIGEYLDLENVSKLEITESDRQIFYDDYWDKFNEVQEEKELEKAIEEEKDNDTQQKKKWWKLW